MFLFPDHLMESDFGRVKSQREVLNVKKIHNALNVTLNVKQNDNNNEALNNVKKIENKVML